MSLFKVAPLEIFDEPLPGGTFPEAEIVGHFSVDGDGELAFDESQKKFLKMPSDLKRVKLDLNEGYVDISTPPDHQLNNIDYILRWIQEDREKHFPSSEFKNAFVGRRQLLAKVMCTPYDKDPWKFGVIFRDDNFYMCEFDREITATPNPEDETWVRSIFWGWKMLQYLTADEADGKPKPDRQCNQNEEFDVVSKLKVNGHVLAYYYGVDAYDKDANCYVDIKTCKHVPEHDERRLRIFQRHKLLKWWAQCQLGAVSEVVGCYRDDSGIVTRLKRMPTREMPDSAREWSANVCYNFLDQFLTWVKQRIPAVDADTRVHVFEYVPQSKIVRYSQTRDEAKMFLPDWYVDSQ